jgi:DNA gyrase subunit A
MADEDPRIVKRHLEDEMKQSYLDYSMSVIVGRALPDVRDGLKPVHRRVLFGMQQMGVFHNKPFKKSARIVGDVMGKFHPHGDAAVYDTLVRMAQDFSLRYPLVQGQGNFGSVDGDSAAAMRYTEARLSKIAGEMLQDLEKDTVEFVANFDNTLKEPTVMPSKLPNLLVNGSAGIAVGMATNIPPHNIIEVCDAVIALIKNPDITIPEMMEYIKGPDFPTGGVIIGENGIRQAYMSGRGLLLVRSKTEIEMIKKDEAAIIVREIPYMVNKTQLIEQIAEAIKDKTVEDISDLRDESDRDGMRIVIELKKDANTDVVLNQLFKHTRLQTTFGVNMLALVNNEPKTLNLNEIIQHYLNHRKVVVRKRTEFDLKKAEQKAHILEGLIIALNSIDAVIKLIRAADSTETARKGLMTDHKLTEIQATAILEMRLQRLTSLEQKKIKDEHTELLKLIGSLNEILASEQRILDIIVSELEELKKEYGDERKTEIAEGGDEDMDFDMEDLIEDSPMVITVSNTGYIKRTTPDIYRQQHRGGRGIVAATAREEDFADHLFIATNHSHILFFTNKGKIYWLKVYKIPEATRTAQGKAIVNLLELEAGESITAMIPIRVFDEESFLVMATREGVVKKTSLVEYSRPRKGGIIAINLDDKDQLVDVVRTNGSQNLLIATKKGQAVKFEEKDARDIGRSARGVRGISLKEGDEVVGMVIADDTKTLLTITDNGYGKRSPVSDYRLIKRGGSGVINIICSERNGDVVAVKAVNDNDELMLISRKGILIRVPAKDISVIGRNTQGVRLMRLEDGDKVMGAAKIVNEEKAAENAEAVADNFV